MAPGNILNDLGWFDPSPPKTVTPKTPSAPPPSPIALLPSGNIPQPGQVSIPDDTAVPAGKTPAAEPPAANSNPPTIPNPIPGPAGDDPGYVPPGGPGYQPPGTPGATPSSTTPPKGTDWVSMFWGSLGLDDTTIAGLTKALTGVTDATQAQLLGQNYLQGTAWYKATFPGFDLGVRSGLFTDLTGYRSYVNALTQSTQQYLGRAVTTAEVTQALQAGVDPTLYANRLQGNALAQTLGPQAQYQAGAFTSEGRLSDSELQAYGQEKAGVDTPLGQAITQRLQLAQQKMQGIFSGTLATPNLSLGPQGLFAPSLQGNKGAPDTGA